MTGSDDAVILAVQGSVSGLATDEMVEDSSATPLDAIRGSDRTTNRADEEVSDEFDGNAEIEEDLEPPPERRSGRAPKPSERGLEYIAQRPSALSVHVPDDNTKANISTNCNINKGNLKKNSTVVGTRVSTDSQQHQRIRPESVQLKMFGSVLINVGSFAGKHAVIVGRRKDGRYVLKVVDSNGNDIGQTVVRLSSLTAVTNLNKSVESVGRVGCDTATPQSHSQSEPVPSATTPTADTIIEMNVIDIDLVNGDSTISNHSGTFSITGIDHNEISNAAPPEETIEKNATIGLPLVSSEVVNIPYEKESMKAVRTDKVPNQVQEEEEEEEEEEVAATAASNILPSPLPSSPSNASLFSIDSPGIEEHYPEVFLDDISPNIAEKGPRGNQPIDVDEVLNEIFEDVERTSDRIETDDVCEVMGADPDDSDGDIMSGSDDEDRSMQVIKRPETDNEKIQLTMRTGSGKKEMEKAINTEEKTTDLLNNSTYNNNDDGDDDDDDGSEDSERATADHIGRFIRLTVGSHAGKLGRVTSISRDMRRYSVTILRSKVCRNAKMHTSVKVNSSNQVFEEDCSEVEKEMIERNRSEGQIRERFLQDNSDRKAFRHAEEMKQKKEKQEAREKAVLLMKESGIDVDNADDENDDDGDYDELANYTEAPRKVCTIPRDTVNKYIRIMSGQYEGLVGRVMSVASNDICSVRVIAGQEHGGRRTSVRAMNCDPSVLVCTDKEKELIQLDKEEYDHKTSSQEKVAGSAVHPPGYDFASKYVRLRSGLYSGAIGKISKYTLSLPFSIRILDMPGMRPNRHTSCTPGSVDLTLNCTSEELEAVERDKALTAHRDFKQEKAVLSTSRTVSSNPSNLNSSSSSGSTSALGSTSTRPPTSSATSTLPLSSTAGASAGDVEDNYVGRYVRLTCGSFREAVGRISSQIPRVHSPGWLFRITIIWEEHWKDLTQEEIDKNPSHKMVQNISLEATALLTNCSELERKAINEDLKKRKRRTGQFVLSKDPSPPSSSSSLSSLHAKNSQTLPSPSSISSIAATVVPSAAAQLDTPVTTFTTHPLPPTSLLSTSLPTSTSTSNLALNLSIIPSTAPAPVPPTSTSTTRASVPVPLVFSPRPWTLIQGSLPPPTRIAEMSEWMGKYVRITAGLFSGKLGRVTSCGMNGTTCSVYILRTGNPQDKTGRHTNMSIPHLQILDPAQLSSKDKAIISDSESRRFKYAESPSKRICDSPSGMSAGKKRVREIDLDSDEEDVPRVEGAKDDDESRNNLYWARSLMLPVLWYGDSSKKPDDLVSVQPIYCEYNEENNGEEERGIKGDKEGKGEGEGEKVNGTASNGEVKMITEKTEGVNDCIDDESERERGIEDDLMRVGDDGMTRERTLVRTECEGVTQDEICVQQDASVSVLSTQDTVLASITVPVLHAPNPLVCAPVIPVKSKTVLTVDTAPSSSSSSSRYPTRPSPLRQSVPRSTLTPLDDDVLQVYCRYKLTSHLSGALLDFAEWDDHLRDSYTWSDWIVQLLSDPLTLSKWVTSALEHPLGKYFHSPRRKFLFCLISEHGGYSLDLEERSSDMDIDDEKPAESSLENLVELTANRMNLNWTNFRKSSNKKGKKDNSFKIGYYLSRELDLDSMRKQGIKCSEEMWELVVLVARMTDNQSHEFSRNVSRVGAQFQALEIPDYKRRKQIKEREIIFTRKRKASLQSESAIKINTTAISKNVTREYSSSALKDFTAQVIKMESEVPESIPPVIWAPTSSFQPAYHEYILMSSREKKEDMKRQKKEVELKVDAAVKSCVHHPSQQTDTKDNGTFSTDIIESSTVIVDRYLKDVHLIVLEFMDAGSLIEAPLSLLTGGSPSPLTMNVSALTGPLDFAALNRAGHHLVLCTVLRQFMAPCNDGSFGANLGSGLKPLLTQTLPGGNGSGLPNIPMVLPSLQSTIRAFRHSLPSSTSVTFSAPAPTSSIISHTTSTSSTTVGAGGSNVDPAPQIPNPSFSTSSASSTLPAKKRSPSLSSVTEFLPPTDALGKTVQRVRKMPLLHAPPCSLQQPRVSSTSSLSTSSVNPTGVTNAIQPNATVKAGIKSPPLLLTSAPVTAVAQTGHPSTHTTKINFTPSATPLSSGHQNGSQSVRWVEVSEGQEGRRVCVPVSMCRVTHFSSERALDVLHRSKYCTVMALQTVRNILSTPPIDSSSSSSCPVPSSTTAPSTSSSLSPTPSNAPSSSASIRSSTTTSSNTTSSTLNSKHLSNSKLTPLESPTGNDPRSASKKSNILNSPSPLPFIDDDNDAKEEATEHWKWTEKELDIFLKAKKRHKSDVQSIWRTVNHKIAARHAALHPPVPASSVPPPTPVPSSVPPMGASAIAPPSAEGVNGEANGVRTVPPVSTITNGSDKEKEKAENSDSTAHTKNPAGSLQISTSTSTSSLAVTAVTAATASIPNKENDTNPNVNAPQLKSSKDIVSLYYRCHQHDAMEENEDIERFKIQESKVATRSQASSSSSATSTATSMATSMASAGASVVVGSAVVHANGADTGTQESAATVKLKPEVATDPLIGQLTKSSSSNPNRWPPTLPFSLHRLYWLKSAESPCLCTGLEGGARREGMLNVIVVCCSTYHQKVTLTANSVEPLLAESAQHRTVCLSDDLSLAFALAMIDFVEWDLKREAVRVTTARGYPASSVSMNALSLETLKRCIKWYEYPPFVTAMVLHPPSWAAWRKKAERAARGNRNARRETYFDSLVADFLLTESEKSKLDSISKPNSSSSSSSSSKRAAFLLSDISNYTMDDRMSTELPWEELPPIVPTPTPTPLLTPLLLTESNLTSTRPALSSIQAGAAVLSVPSSSSSSSSSSTSVTQSRGMQDVSAVSGTRDALPVRTTTLWVPSTKITVNTDATALSAANVNGQRRRDTIPSYTPTPLIPPPTSVAVPSSAISDPSSNIPKYFFSLFWLKRSALPCIRIDWSNENEERFAVTPICCTTYHYSVKVRITELHPLTEELVQLCIDDRTIDFTLALMDFAQWDHARQKQKVTQAHKNSTTLPRNGGSVGTGTISGMEAAHTHADSAIDSSDNVVEEVPRYVWPEFVLTMLRRPTDWASWRKRVERSISAQKDIALKQRSRKDPDTISDSQNSDGSISEKSKSSTETVKNTDSDIDEKASRLNAPLKRRKAYFLSLCGDHLAG